ncbi:GntP family permease [Romboutsia sp. Marseille-P6047]|uniref:GntP family permease n=1 Tax=Romboutsia sp. Marseille-P6047 TaxID=2161817 RepID=UPI000F065068|nr:gluconate:H+ symporter [Romboutsia sp. Marseille-P6047]
MTEVSSTQMILGLVIGIGVLIFLSMKTKVHTFLALIFAAMITGLIGGMDVSSVLSSITTGFGNTLSSTGIIIGLGVMMGAVLEKSGAAEQLAFSVIKLVGKKKEEWALGITGYIVSIPVFADSALVILTPLAKALSKVSGKSAVSLGLSLAIGLQLTHTFVPPTPGPLTVAGLLGVDVGMMILSGVLVTIIPFIVCIFYCKWMGTKVYQIPNDSGDGYTKKEFKKEYIKEIENVEELMKNKDLPPLLMSILPILVPLVMIFANTICSFAGIEYQIITFIGSPIVALSVGVLIAVYGLARDKDKSTVMSYMEDGIKSTGMIMLITGAGGALGFIVRDSGIGTALGELVLNLPIPAILIPFIIAALMRIALGSATVALTTAATLTAPLLSVVGLDPIIAAMATCAGGVAFSYFNDSGFWVFNGMYGLKEMKDQMYAKFGVSMVGSLTALAIVIIANMLFF